MSQKSIPSTTITAAESEEVKRMRESARRDYLEAHKNANGVQNANTSPELAVKCLCDESTNTASVVAPLGITKLATFAKLPGSAVKASAESSLSESPEESDNDDEKDESSATEGSNEGIPKSDPAAARNAQIERIRAVLRGLPSPKIIQLEPPGDSQSIMFSPDLKYASIVTNSLNVMVVHMEGTVEAFTIRAADPSLQPSLSRFATAFSFRSSSSPQAPARVLGSIWPYSDTLVIVTTETVEVYTIKGARSTLAKAFSSKNAWFKYSRKRRTVLALVSQTTLQPYDFSVRGEYTKLSRVELVKAPQPGFVPSVHVGIVDVCGETLVAQLSWPEKKLPQPCVTLFPWNKDASPINLMIPYGPERDGNVRFQSVDNLVVVHDLMHKVSFFYDLTISGFPVIPCPVVVQPDQVEALNQEPIPAPLMCKYFSYLTFLFGVKWNLLSFI